MKHIKTMAVIISEETYPIAVACLRHGFATIPYDTVIGSMLVINDLYAVPSKKRKGAPTLTIRNGWMTPDDFTDRYRPVGWNANFKKFTEVERIAN